MRNQYAAGLSLIATLAAGIGLIACQFVAGITDEEPNSTVASTSSSTAKSSSVSSESSTTSVSASSSTGPDCGPKDGLGCTGDCEKYCTDIMAHCVNQSVKYPSKEGCCAMCSTFENNMNVTNTAMCRDVFVKGQSIDCTKAGPYSLVCGMPAATFDDAATAICGESLTTTSPSLNQDGALLYAAEAKYFGCDTTCLCGNVASNGMAICKPASDCVAACK